MTHHRHARFTSFVIAVVLSNGMLAGMPPSRAEAVTTADAEIPPDRLKLLAKPLTKDELADEADAWRDLLKRKVAEITNLQAQAKQPATAPAALAQLQAERTLLTERLRAVLDEWEKKGGDPGEYRLYANAVGGLDVDVSDAGHTLRCSKPGCFRSREGYGGPGIS